MVCMALAHNDRIAALASLERCAHP